MLILMIFKLKLLYVKEEDKLELQLLFIILQTLINFIKKAKKKEKKEKKKEKKMKEKNLKKMEKVYNLKISFIYLFIKSYI